MKLKKITKYFEMVYSDTSDLNEIQSYIPSDDLRRDKSALNAIMVFYLISNRCKNCECNIRGKVIVYQNTNSYISLKRPIQINMLHSDNYINSAYSPSPTYRFDLSGIGEDIPYNVKAIFCSKITQTIMNIYGSHLFLYYNGDEATKRIAEDIGYKLYCDKNCARFDFDDLLAIGRPKAI